MMEQRASLGLARQAVGSVRQIQLGVVSNFQT
jgi:hypothetical protein